MPRGAPRASPTHRLIQSVATLVTFCCLLFPSACALPGSGPDAEDAATHLAASLSMGALSHVDFAGDDTVASRAYARLTQGLERTGRPQVSVTGVTGDGDRATGKLKWIWHLGSAAWSYDTVVRLARAHSDAGKAWLVRWSPTLIEPSLRSEEVLDSTRVEPERGDILGAQDTPLVTPRPVIRIGIDKTGLLTPAEASRSATSLARLTGIDSAAYVTRVVAAGRRAFVEGLVYRRAETPPAVLGGLSRIRGARAVSDHLPLAPTKDFASALLGTVGPATAQAVKEGSGRIEAGDVVGLSGLQKRYDEQLSGTRGVTVAAVDERGVRRTLFTAGAVAGKPLRTTLDLAAQQRAQRVLANVRPASALVAIRPSNGDLVAAASGPGSGGYDTATIGRYPPGSTFKIVTALALLRAGLSVSSPVSCPPGTVVDGKKFMNYDDYPVSGLGRIRFEDAFANSCNTAFIGERDRLHADAQTQAAAALGLGVDHDTGFPSYFGQVPAPESLTAAAASMIGQGSVLASPMAMATVVASVVKGATVVPRLLTERSTGQAEPGSADAATASQPTVPLTAAEAQQLRLLMRRVVERGSGKVLKGLPGTAVIAKTGTAEFGRTPPLPTHVWMVAGRGDLAVAVFVERGRSGSATAGPILRSFLDRVR